MAYRKATIRHMGPVAKRYAKLVNEADSLVRWLKGLLGDIQRGSAGMSRCCTPPLWAMTAARVGLSASVAERMAAAKAKGGEGHAV